MREVYLDNNATTPVDEEVLETMIETLRDNYGNPSSGHRRGARARKALEAAREKVAALLMATPAEILFCSGGTEANNAAILSAVQQAGKRRRLVTTPVEHPAVLNPMKKLADAGYDVREIPVLPSGELDLAAAEELITPETALVSVMAANNETGVLHPWAKVAQLGAAQGAFVHVDAVQAVAKVPIDLRRVPVDLLTISGHKLHSPKGIGALYVKKGRKLTPLLLGGHQEKGRRGGTENVPAAAALGKSCELLMVCDHRRGGARDGSSRAPRGHPERQQNAARRRAGS
ncbi:MAG: cysteine desulfurase family protein [Acidobacteriota bacterium]